MVPSDMNGSQSKWAQSWPGVPEVVGCYGHDTTSLTQNILGIVYILCTYSILEYLWNILNILGIFPQYSGLVFLLFTVIW